MEELDGVYSLFGYVLDGVDQLDELKPGDIIQSMKVLSGNELLQRPSFNPSYARRRTQKSQRDYQMLSGEVDLSKASVVAARSALSAVRSIVQDG